MHHSGENSQVPENAEASIIRLRQKKVATAAHIQPGDFTPISQLIFFPKTKTSAAREHFKLELISAQTYWTPIQGNKTCRKGTRLWLCAACRLAEIITNNIQSWSCKANSFKSKKQQCYSALPFSKAQSRNLGVSPHCLCIPLKVQQKKKKKCGELAVLALPCFGFWLALVKVLPASCSKAKKTTAPHSHSMTADSQCY